MQKNKNILLLLAIMVTASLSCNIITTVPVKKAVQTATPVTEPSSVIPDATSAPASTEPAQPADSVQFSGYTDYLRAQMLAKKWSLEDGLIATLKAFVGETAAGSADVQKQVFSKEGTGIVLLADNYLRSGKDTAAKAEITRLLGLLVPSQQVLDLYSVSESKVTGFVGGMARAAAPEKSYSSGTKKQVDNECATLWRNGFPVIEMPSFPCFMFGERTVAGHSYKVYYPMSWVGDAGKYPYYSAALVASQAAIDYYKTLGDVKSINIIFSTMDIGGFDALTYYAYFRGDEACPILIHPSALRGGADLAFNQLIAHEIFHCFQSWNLHHQYVDAEDSVLWWSEGTAEYFSNLVYKDVNNEHQYARRFAERSTTVSLIHLSYENFAFFQFLGNQVGPEGVLSVLRTMPVTPGARAQMVALAAVHNIDTIFEAFTRAVMDNKLKDSDGSIIRFPEVFTDEVYLNDIDSREFTGRPFVLARYSINLPREKSFTTESPSDGLGQSAWRVWGADSGWGAFPAIITGTCDETLLYGGYVITTAPETEQKQTIAIVSATARPCDKCLFGRWNATNDSVKAYMQSVANAGGNTSTTVNSVTGIMFMEFGEDGLGRGGFENLELIESIAGGKSQIGVFFNGDTSGPYSTDGTSLSGLKETVNILVTVKIPGTGVMEIPFKQEDFPISSRVPMRYTCT